LKMAIPVKIENGAARDRKATVARPGANRTCEPWRMPGGRGAGPAAPIGLGKLRGIQMQACVLLVGAQ